MNFKPIASAVAVFFVLFAVATVFAAPGDRASDADFNLNGQNTNGTGIVYDGTYFRVVDILDDKVYTYEYGGTYVSSLDFNLTGVNGSNGVTWDETYLRVVDDGGNKVYTYQTDGTHVSGQDFSLASGNSDPRGMTWDGTYFRVLDNDDKVYAYEYDGTHVSAEDFNLTGGIGDRGPTGITWDGTYIRVLDSVRNEVSSYNESGVLQSSEAFSLGSSNTSGITYDGQYFRIIDRGGNSVQGYEAPPRATVDTSSSVYGLTEEHPYVALLAGEVSIAANWKCIATTTAQSFRVNNGELSVEGFCAQPKGSAGMEVEIHLSESTTASALGQFSQLTGSWWVVESGFSASANRRVYDDNSTATGTVAFTEDPSELLSSNRLGDSRPTLVKRVEDADCAEETDKSGFACNRSWLTGLAAGDTALLLFSVTDANNWNFADMPHTPESFVVSRSADYTTATLGWALYDAASEYEIERNTAVQVQVGEQSFVEYGDPVTYMVASSQAGVVEFEDASLEAHRTYQFRIRARGGDAFAWSEWSDYVFSGADTTADVAAPLNIELARSSDSVTISWNAPPGDLDGFTIQRQELITDEDDNSFFANPMALTDDWIPVASTTYEDSTITPTHIYEYRVAAVVDDRIGAYSDWFRSGGSAAGTFGQAPPNLRLVETTSRIFDERFLFWMEWDPVANAEDYEIETVSYALNSGDGTSSTRYVSTSTAFFTIYNRVESRVRARDDSGGSSEWTAWYPVRFTPRITVPAPEMVDEGASSTTTAELREDMEDLVMVMLEPLGGEVNTAVVLEFGVLVGAMILGAISISVAWARGMAPLGVGMGAAIFVLVLFTGWRLFGTSIAWPIGAEILILVPGAYAVYQKWGIFGR